MTDGPQTDTGVVTGDATLTASNIGGIDTAQVEFSPGVTLLTGYNATNRTSLLRAVNGVLGGTEATLRSSADEGEVSLTIGDETYTRSYRRTGSGVVASGEPFTDSEALVDLFVSLFEDNEVRRTVARGKNLHDVVMRPVDTAAIERRIRELQTEREELQREQERVAERRNELPELEQRRSEIDERIETIDERIADLRATVAEFEEDAEAAEDANEIVDELDSRRQELSETEDEIELVESELSALETELEELREERAALPGGSEADRSDLERTLTDLRQEKRELDAEISSLTTILEFNREILADEDHQLPSIEAEDEDVTAALAPEPEQGVVCWTCGSRVERGAIDDRLAELESIVEGRRSDREDAAQRIDEVEDRLAELEQQRQRSSSVEHDIERTEEKIDQREQRLEQLESTAATLREAIQELEVEAAETEALRENDLLETYEELSELQYERGQLEQERDDIDEELADISDLPDPGDLSEQVDELSRELEQQRSHITDLETAVVEEFNERMADILGILQFSNIARVWIERKGGAGDARGSETTFDLHVIREDEGGTVYEDVIDHLSESEREVIGLVVALSGYLAHDVHETVPFITLDSLEAIDAERIADLVSYFADFSSYLLVALLPEDADALPDIHDRISPAEFRPTG
ncbi:archaea-specific SMC-related protein [Haloglomus halophilum]|uniref:archaea-specific SMC-related protein n=1 Tax=Haloglomus halophilum TaxID=2962672 RepID=UPI0020C9802E|nr:archaea-specific SMC-related protein [Haloglomus halophilum]